MHGFWEPIRQILPIGTQWTRFVQWVVDICGVGAQNCAADRAPWHGQEGGRRGRGGSPGGPTSQAIYLTPCQGVRCQGCHSYRPATPTAPRDRPGNRGCGDPEPTTHRSREPIRQILPIGTQWTRFVQWVVEICGFRAQSCAVDRALWQAKSCKVGARSV